MIRRPRRARRFATRKRVHCIVAMMAALALASCDDGGSGEVTEGETPSAAATAPKSKDTTAAAEPTKIKAISSAMPELSDTDFIESESNRDPFRSFLGEFVARTVQNVTVQRKVILQRYGLDELRLIAVVTGGTRAQAMFRDPTGLGVVVKRGDYVSKSAAKVKQILSDRVVMEMQELAEGAEEMAERVILLHPGRERVEAGL